MRVSAAAERGLMVHLQSSIRLCESIVRPTPRNRVERLHSRDKATTGVNFDLNRLSLFIDRRCDVERVQYRSDVDEECRFSKVPSWAYPVAYGRQEACLYR